MILAYMKFLLLIYNHNETQPIQIMGKFLHKYYMLCISNIK